MNTHRASLDALTGDYRAQADFVVDAAWRLLSLQDDNQLSPSHGCFHYAYWRDKTSEFPDARFQEAGAALGLLSLPFFDSARHDGRLPPAATLYAAFSAGLCNLATQQYPEGCFDEWYKGERGFAATEFTLIAYGLAARMLGDRMLAADRQLLAEVAAKAGAWLARHDDRVKANHQAAGAAALALIWELTGDVQFRTAARRKLDDTLARQQPEGWFPEIGGMDLGYCSVLLDYVMIHAMVTQEDVAFPAMARLISFMLPLLHPDGTTSPEMGLCLNPYVSRLGIGLLSCQLKQAQSIVATMRVASPGTEGLRPYLSDDLRLARWSYLPLMSALIEPRFITGSVRLIEAFSQGWTWNKAAAVGAFHSSACHLYFMPAGGGGVRVFRGGALCHADLGYRLRAGSKWLGNAGYDPDRAVGQLANGYSVSCEFGEAKFLFPSFLSRLVLRLGCSTAIGARLLRSAIDYVRLKRRTASNQSAAPVAGKATGYRLERQVQIDGPVLHVIDRITISPGLPAVDIMPLMQLPDGAEAVPSQKFESGALTLVKTLDFTADGAMTFSWRKDA